MTDNVDDFLQHFGVKGMKWGVSRAADGVKGALADRRDKKAAVKAERKATSEQARELGYSPVKRASDYESMGARGVRRIEKRIVNGESIGKARFKEGARATGTGLGIGLGLMSVTYGPFMLNSAARDLSSHINAKRGAEAARNLFADNKGLTSYATVALTFDKAKGSFGL